MGCEKCGAKTHRDDAMERRCNGCEWLVSQCICQPKAITVDELMILADKQDRHNDMVAQGIKHDCAIEKCMEV